MRINKFFKYMFLVATILLLSRGMPVYADEVNADDLNEGVAGNINNSTTGFSKNRSGYLIYITNADGGTMSDVVYVPFTNKPASNVSLVGLRTRVTNKFYTRISPDTISDITNGGFNQPPFCVVTDSAFGNSMKAWLQADSNNDGNANTYDLIINLFGESKAKDFKEYDWYLCIEAVTSLAIEHSDNTVYYAGTSYTLNALFKAHGADYCDNIRRMRLPHCGFLIEDGWAGVSAPEIHSGQKESYDDLLKKQLGFGMIMVRSNETEDPEPDTEDPDPITPAPTISDVDDYLKANELCYLFPDMIMASSAGRSAEHYSTVANSYVNMASNLQHGGTLRDGKWYVTETITSDALNFYGDVTNFLYYRGSAGQWATPSSAKTFSSTAGNLFPGYGYLLTRSLWGDNLVACDYKSESAINYSGNAGAIRSFLTNRLGMQIGHTASSGMSAIFGH